MKTYRIAQVFLGLMGLAFCKTGIESLLDPQAVLENVGIVLGNASATSSMRAVYGGMHLVFGLFCIYGIFRNQASSLMLVALYTAGFTIGRLSGIIVDGMPNQFVITWLTTEVVCGLAAIALFAKLRKGSSVSPRYAAQGAEVVKA
ncbi:MAG TPA: DUF4345 domain-containing protein [Cyclobacteriaceae bacterium]|nr:DUF4345 domain-containing protein [Cyclobacteriaceae bacterium]